MLIYFSQLIYTNVIIFCSNSCSLKEQHTFLIATLESKMTNLKPLCIEQLLAKYKVDIKYIN